MCLRGSALKRAELAWVDTFFEQSKDHMFIREDDNVLILPPNRVYKLIESGLGLLLYLFSGKKIINLDIITDGRRAEDVHNFFCDLRCFYTGCPELPDKRRAVERVSYDFDFTRLPVLGEIAVTYRCNNSCLFCYAGCGNDHEKNEEMSLKEIKYIITLFRTRAKIPFFSFTGGEPLIRRDLEKMIRFAYKTGLQVNLITNGTLADPQRASSLYKSGLRTAQVSVESHIPEIHDRLTGRPGSFEQVLQGIQYLQKAGISVQTNTTLTRLNVPGIEEYPAFIRELGIKRFSMNIYIPSGRGLYHKELFYPYSKIGPVIERIRKAAYKQKLTFYWYSPVPYCYYNPVARGLGNKSCAAMDGLISVSPKGSVLPCSSYPEEIGNLLYEDFHHIWFSRRAAYFKQKHFALDECSGCDKFTACQSACPLYWKYAGTGEIKRINYEN
jgi:radical SAM protein with 4Fe4S-binding SPASM domain